MKRSCIVEFYVGYNRYLHKYNLIIYFQLDIIKKVNLGNLYRERVLAKIKYRGVIVLCQNNILIY